MMNVNNAAVNTAAVGRGFAAAAAVSRDSPTSYLPVAARAVAADPAGRWTVRPAGMWAVLRPAGRPLRCQGWKLHVSATPLSMPAVLAAVLPVLVAERCTAKFAISLDEVRRLNSARCPRAMVGKCVTVYPDDDEQFRRLAGALHRATAGLTGPEILSDRRYRPGSLVHCRYGGFTESAVLDDDGCYRPMIVGPDGVAVEDRREAWFSPPAWAPPAFPGEPALAGPPDPAVRPPAPAGGAVASRLPAGARPVLVGGRFVVVRAIRYTGRGGVFAGYDRQTGAPVVVKQARAYVDVDPAGDDCRDQLRHEVEMLARLAPLGLAPGVLRLLDEGEHVFLIRDRLAGDTLRTWVADQADTGGVPTGAGLAMARRLVELVDRVHRAGLVLMDVSPNNVLIDPAGRPWLVDLDHAAVAGQRVYPVGTPAYTPPEHLVGDARAVPARAAADLFGLGGLLFLLATGTDPTLAPAEPDRWAEPAGRTARDRLRAWLGEIRSDLPLVDALAAAVLGLTCQRPEARWRPERVLRFLDRPRPAAATVLGRPGLPALPGPDRLIADGLAWLASEQAPAADRLWPSGQFGAGTDPCAVQHGAAGVLAALVAAAPWVAEAGQVREAAAVACRWIEARLPAEPRLLPGLYFGRSGTAWALYDAATLLGDAGLASTALDLAARLPVTWPSPDVAHGLAGAGLAQLHLWLASGQPRFEPRVRACADGLLAAARVDGEAVSWPIPATLRSSLAGRTYHGFAHGTAGVGAFLLAAGGATGDRRYTDLAVRAAATVADAAVVRDGAAYWPLGPDDGTPGGTGWCTGSAGAGRFLLPAWQVTGEPRLLELARAAGRAVYRGRGQANTAACHGLAGGGHLLLDLAEALAEPGYRDQAGGVARVLAARAVRRGTRLLVADETGLGVVADYGVGLAGVLGFLVRLRYHTRPLWTVEVDGRADPARTGTIPTEGTQ